MADRYLAFIILLLRYGNHVCSYPHGGDGGHLHGKNVTVTPRDIDAQVRDLSKVVGYAVNWALQDLEIEEINALLS